MSTLFNKKLFWVTWEDGRGGRIRTQYPRDKDAALSCVIGLERSGAEEVELLPCRESGLCGIPIWRMGDPGFYYFSKVEA